MSVEAAEAEKALHPPVIPPGGAGRSERFKSWLMAPAVVSLLLWMIVPLGMTIYFSFIRYNLLWVDQPSLSEAGTSNSRLVCPRSFLLSPLSPGNGYLFRF